MILKSKNVALKSLIFITFSNFSAVADFMIVMQSLADAFSIMIRYTLHTLHLGMYTV